MFVFLEILISLSWNQTGRGGRDVWLLLGPADLYVTGRWPKCWAVRRNFLRGLWLPVAACCTLVVCLCFVLDTRSIAEQECWRELCSWFGLTYLGQVVALTWEQYLWTLLTLLGTLRECVSLTWRRGSVILLETDTVLTSSISGGFAWVCKVVLS